MGYARMDISGTDEVQRMLEHVADVPQMAAQALRAGADVLLPIERQNAPVGPGGGAHIRDRLEIRIRTGGRPSALVGVWDEPVAYYVEHGHGGPHPAPAHPYMAPAAEEAEDEVTAAIVDAIKAYLDG